MKKSDTLVRQAGIFFCSAGNHHNNTPTCFRNMLCQADFLEADDFLIEAAIFDSDDVVKLDARPPVLFFVDMFLADPVQGLRCLAVVDLMTLIYHVITSLIEVPYSEGLLRHRERPS